MHSRRLGIVRRVPVLVVPAVFATSVAWAQAPGPAAASTTSPPPADSSTPPAEHPAWVAPHDHDRVEMYPSGHAAFGIGGAAGGSNAGFRLGLDASFGVALASDGDRAGAWTLAPSIITGFGKYPTYVTLDFGRLFFSGDGQFAALAGVAATVGPAVRVDFNAGAGGEVSVRAYFVVFQVGIRAVTIVTDGPEVQVEGTVGLGFF